MSPQAAPGTLWYNSVMDTDAAMRLLRDLELRLAFATLDSDGGANVATGTVRPSATARERPSGAKALGADLTVAGGASHKVH